MKTKMTRFFLNTVLGAAALALVPTIANAQGFERQPNMTYIEPALKERIEKGAPAWASHQANVWCSNCHGPGGKGGPGLNPLFPILAGQQADYLENQLKSFRALTQDELAVNHETYVERWIKNITGWRRDVAEDRYPDAFRYEDHAWDFMKGVARDLDDPTIKALAVYMSKQPGVPGRPSKGDVAKGKILFEQGAMDKGLLPCASCHGNDAHGNASIPRLAGQYEDYVYDQVKFIKSGLRQVEQMAPLVQNMTDDDIRAVAAYVQTLN